MILPLRQLYFIRSFNAGRKRSACTKKPTTRKQWVYKRVSIQAKATTTQNHHEKASSASSPSTGGAAEAAAAATDGSAFTLPPESVSAARRRNKRAPVVAVRTLGLVAVRPEPPVRGVHVVAELHPLVAHTAQHRALADVLHVRVQLELRHTAGDRLPEDARGDRVLVHCSALARQHDGDGGDDDELCGMVRPAPGVADEMSSLLNGSAERS